MSYRFQTTHRSFDPNPGAPVRGGVEPFVGLGDVTEILVRAVPKSDRRLTWRGMAFGMVTRGVEGGNRLSHANLDQLFLVERWCRLTNMRFAVPIYGHRTASSEPFRRVGPGWALGYYDPKPLGGFVLVANTLVASREPILGDWEQASTWLFAEQWVAEAMLRDMAAAAAVDCSRAA